MDDSTISDGYKVLVQKENSFELTRILSYLSLRTLGQKRTKVEFSNHHTISNGYDGIFTSFAFTSAYVPYAPYALKYERVKYERVKYERVKLVKTKDYHLNKVQT